MRVLIALTAGYLVGYVMGSQEGERDALDRDDTVGREVSMVKPIPPRHPRVHSSTFNGWERTG